MYIIIDTFCIKEKPGMSTPSFSNGVEVQTPTIVSFSDSSLLQLFITGVRQSCKNLQLCVSKN